jgi:hypothetical protein
MLGAVFRAARRVSCSGIREAAKRSVQLCGCNSLPATEEDKTNRTSGTKDRTKHCGSEGT